jgi:ribosomal protein S18 acetylase RimI-like enzyme
MAFKSTNQSQLARSGPGGRGASRRDPNPHKLELRPLRHDNHATVAGWLQDPDALQWAGGLGLLTCWLLLDSRVEVFVGWSEGRPISAIGAEHGAGEVILALVVDPERRGEGFGSATVRALAADRCYRDRLLSCEIATANVASQRAFESAGFHAVDGDDLGYTRYERNPCFRC